MACQITFELLLTNLTKFMIDESRTLNVFELVYDIDDLLATMMMLTMIMSG